VTGTRAGTLASKVAIVTGGGRGIGKATALLFAAEGAHVVTCARTVNDLETLVRVAPSIHAIPGDIVGLAFIEHIFSESVRIHGRIDIVVNNAAVLGRMPILELGLELWDDILGVNLRAPFLCCRAAFQQMSQQQPSGGSIINVASLSGVRGPEKFPGLSAYNASKAGLLALSDSLAVEGRPLGIRVNAVSPGAVETQMLRQAGHGLRALATADDIARTILYLASDDSRPITGANVEVLSNA